MQVRLREEQLELLRQWAAERGVSIAELIRQGVGMLIQSSGAVDDAERRRRAIAGVGRFRSGASDVSSEHDRCLVEAHEDCKR
jgi:hypothetical protein